jgi:hypothetical protein
MGMKCNLDGRNIWKNLYQKCGGRDYRRNFKICERILKPKINFGDFRNKGVVLDVTQLKAHVNTVINLRVLHKQAIAAEQLSNFETRVLTIYLCIYIYRFIPKFLSHVSMQWSAVPLFSSYILRC